VLAVVNSVSMPLAVSAEVFVGCGLLAIFAGTVNERRTVGAAGAACSGVLEAGDDMAAASLDHRCRKLFEMRVAWNGAGVACIFVSGTGGGNGFERDGSVEAGPVSVAHAPPPAAKS
jgi:hypothetical protein